VRPAGNTGGLGGSVTIREFVLPEHEAVVRYRDVPGRNPACVYLHGLGSSAIADFSAVVEQLELAGRRSVLVDLLGFGQSDRPLRFSYSVDGHAQVVASLIAQLSVGPCALVGHSLGGSIALRVASAWPQWVSRLLVAEANLESGPLEGSNAVFSRSVACQTDPEYCATGYRNTLAWADREMPALALQLRRAAPQAIYRSAVSLVAGATPTWMEQLLTLSIPRAYVFGERSLINQDMAERAERLRATDVKVLVLPNAAHDMRLDIAPQDFAALVARWLAG
jgi:pimeloyl-ACP methyl ester carboxylesterase